MSWEQLSEAEKGYIAGFLETVLNRDEHKYTKKLIMKLEKMMIKNKLLNKGCLI
jgi:hypothetical protein